MSKTMDGHSDSEDSLDLAAKSWNRIIDGASKNGYREGIEEGSQAIFQEDFDRGYEDGFKAGFELGKYKGLATTFSKDFKHPDNIAEILDKTRRGACHICTIQNENNDNENKNSEVSTTDFLDNHRKHVTSTLKVLDEYFEPFMKEREREREASM